MKLLFLSLISLVALASCADEKVKPVGPVSDTSLIPWNAPVAGQGGGQFGMLPQNQHRR